MKTPKKLTVTLVLGMVMILLAACGSGGNGQVGVGGVSTEEASVDSLSPDGAASQGGSASAADAADLKGKLVIWTYFDQVKEMAAKFQEEHPDVTIDVQVFPGDQYETKLLTALQSGRNVPDIIDLDRGYIGKFLDSKFLADLSGMGAEELVKDHLPYVQAYGRSSDGKIRAISDNSSPGGFWYIRENAKKWLGTDDPDQISAMVDNWDKVIELGKKVKQESGGKVHLIQSASSLFDIEAYNTQPWMKAGKLSIDPKWKNTYETQLKIRAEGVDAKLGFMSAGWASALNDGSVVLTSMPSWAAFMVDNKDGKAKGKFGVAKTPEGFFLGGRYEGIYERSPNKELAYEVLKYIAGPEWQLYNLEHTGNMPSNAIVFDKHQDTFKSEMFGDQFILKAYAEQMKAMPAHQADKYNEGVLSKWGKTAGEGLNQNKKYDDVLDAFKKEVKNTYPEIQVD